MTTKSHHGQGRNPRVAASSLRADQEGPGRFVGWGRSGLRIVASRDDSPAYGPMESGRRVVLPNGPRGARGREPRSCRMQLSRGILGKRGRRTTRIRAAHRRSSERGGASCARLRGGLLPPVPSVDSRPPSNASRRGSARGSPMRSRGRTGVAGVGPRAPCGAGLSSQGREHPSRSRSRPPESRDRRGPATRLRSTRSDARVGSGPRSPMRPGVPRRTRRSMRSRGAGFALRSRGLVLASTRRFRPIAVRASDARRAAVVPPTGRDRTPGVLPAARPHPASRRQHQRPAELEVMGRAGLEPATPAFSVLCSTS